MTAIYVFGGLLVAISGGLLAWHAMAWKEVKADDSLDERERGFAWRQCRRRSQASGMIGLIGVGLAGIRLVLMTGSGVVVTVYVLLLIAITVWIMLLAVADMAATRVHYSHRHHLKAREVDQHGSSDR